MKSRSYLLDEKYWLNSKYIIIKQDYKLNIEFFRSFRVLHLVGKQDHKIELFKNWRIYDIFHILFLK